VKHLSATLPSINFKLLIHFTSISKPAHTAASTPAIVSKAEILITASQAQSTAQTTLAPTPTRPLLVATITSAIAALRSNLLAVSAVPIQSTPALIHHFAAASKSAKQELF
jgi:hypothetical protein